MSLRRKAPVTFSRPEGNPEAPAVADYLEASVPPSAKSATLRPLAAQGTSTWTTISPRFVVQYASYIPVDHIAGPTACGVQLQTVTMALGWKAYKGDAFRQTYRTTESLLVIPSAQKYGNLFARGGPTRNYQIPSSPANGLFASLSSTPTGDRWSDPYTGADEDEQRFDCRFWNDKGEADNSAMRGVGVTFGNPITQVNLYGFGQDPLEPRLPGSGIKWNLIVSLDTTDAAHPKAWVSSGTATCYPAHIVKVNGTKIFERQPLQNNTLFLLACLDEPGAVVSPSIPVVVPAH